MLFFGVIYLRPGHESAQVHIQTMEAILKENLDLSSSFIITGENNMGFIRIRFRQLP